jgi:hypothetical protein
VIHLLVATGVMKEHYDAAAAVDTDDHVSTTKPAEAAEAEAATQKETKEEKEEGEKQAEQVAKESEKLAAAFDLDGPTIKEIKEIKERKERADKERQVAIERKAFLPVLGDEVPRIHTK